MEKTHGPPRGVHGRCAGRGGQSAFQDYRPLSQVIQIDKVVNKRFPWLGSR